MGGKIFKSIFIIFVLFFACQAFGYDNLKTHPLLSGSAAAVYNQNSGHKLTDSQKSWIIKGSIDEDNDPRYVNHFYNPIIGKGLDGYDRINKLIIKVQGKSAKAWAKSQNSATGDYSESAILKNYQDGNLTRAYQGIGHIIHLIQDMAVPAHTRNDPHAGGDPYEKWAEQYATINPNKLNFLNINSLDQAFDLMANYSNNNFFSKDSIAIDKFNNYKTTFESVDYKRRMYLLNELGGLTFKLAYTKNPDSVAPVFQVDDDFKLNLGYWNMLYPKAVGYSAGVIDYFVKQFEQIDKAKKEQEQASLWGKLKNSLAWLKQEAQYAWGDSFMAQRNVLASGYNNFLALSGGAQDNFQNFSDANREIVEGAANQAGQVLSAFEQAGSGEEIFKPQPAGAENASEMNINPLNHPLEGGQMPAANPNPLNPPLEGGQMPIRQPQPITVKPASPAPTFIFVAGDSLSPETAITSGPNQLTNLSSAVFIFTASEANSTFGCDLNSAGWQGCDSPKNFTNLVDGSHIFKVRALDASNNIDLTPAEFSWTVDLTAPQITITSGPPAFASSTTANFQFVSSESETAYQCRLDANAWQTCSASTTAASLIEGSHSLEVKGADQAGNVGSSTIKTWLLDLTAAASTMASLDASYEATGFTVAWSGTDIDAAGATTTASGLENFDVQYKIGAGVWQDWINATTSTSTIFNLAVGSGQTIYFQVRARDLAGNLGEWSAAAQTVINDYLADHVVISEFASRGPIGALDEFMELYNPTGEDVNLSGWKLQTKSAGGISWINRTGLSGLPAGIIRARGYYLITANNYSLSVVPDYRHSANWGLADDGGHVRIINDLEEEIDKIGYGGAIDPEGSALAVDLSDGKSLERKAAAASTAETMAAGGAQAVSGNGYDSDNNNNDFILRTSPKPQNSSSPAESINNPPDLTAPISSVAALNEFYQFTGFTVRWSGEDFDDAGATTTASGSESYDAQYKISAGDWQNWVNATTSTSTIFNIAVADGQTVYFRSRARDYAGNLESWPADENGDAGTTVDSVVIFYDVVRDNVLAANNFGRDYIITNFKPTASSISGISIKTTVNNANDGSNYTITLCQGALTADNLTAKINCGPDILIAQKTCATDSGVNVWQNCTFNNSFHITPLDDYYVVLGDSTWLASSWSVTDYGSLMACGFQSDGSELYCFNNNINAFLTLRTYYDKTISY